MDNYKSNFALDTISSSLMEQQTADRIFACNEEIRKYGLVLTRQQVLALVQTRTNALKQSKRIELDGGIVDELT